MMLVFDSMNSGGYAKLMELYNEGNRENVAYFKSEAKTAEEIEAAVQEIETGFITYLKDEFFLLEDARYYVLEEEGQWVSALRINREQDYYYLEALETHPDHRRRGHAAKLMELVLEQLKQQGSFILRDAVKKTNIPSLKTHEKCGFTVEREEAVYPSGQVQPNNYGMIYRWDGK